MDSFAEPLFGDHLALESGSGLGIILHWTSLKLDSGTINRYIDQVWRAGLDVEKLSQEAKDKVGGNLESALLRTMQDVVPNITPDSLATWAGRRIQEKAPQYGINPENIALNK